MVWRRDASPWEKFQSCAACWCGVPDFPGLCWLDVCNCASGQIYVEAEEVEILDCLKFDQIAEEIMVDQCLYCWVGEEKHTHTLSMKDTKYTGFCALHKLDVPRNGLYVWTCFNTDGWQTQCWRNSDCCGKEVKEVASSMRGLGRWGDADVGCDCTILSQEQHHISKQAECICWYSICMAARFLGSVGLTWFY